MEGNFFPPAGSESGFNGESAMKPFVPRPYGEEKIIADREAA